MSTRFLQRSLLNAVCASLIKEPNFSSGDSRSKTIVDLVNQLAKTTPEFILKLALYLRDDLNIRTTANFLLALASVHTECRPYLKLYVPATVRLPSDWIEVAKLVKKIPGRDIAGLPSALRNALEIKFQQFDEFSLAKYNKEKSVAKRNARDRESDMLSDSDDGGHVLETLKQMVRCLHIGTPVYHVMCLTGKRYPLDREEFHKSGLPGEFDDQRAGKRMKLQVPITWETQLSALGNKASTWETLLDDNKLPFMAMLRNLRNMIEAGISMDHHQKIMSILKDERAIARSRQFPFRFFSAYEAVDVDLNSLVAGPDGQLGFPKRTGQAGGKGKGGKGGAKGGKGGRGPPQPPKVTVPTVMPTAELLEQYRSALDTAVKLATMHNIRPIHGSTIVMCNVSEAMEVSASGARGMGASVRTVREVAMLLALMFKYSCEQCVFVLFDAVEGGHKIVHSLKDDFILKNMDQVKTLARQFDRRSRFPFAILNELLKDRKKVDNLVVLSDAMLGPGGENYEAENPLGTGGISAFLEKYRSLVNADLLYVSVDVAGNAGVSSEESDHPNNVALTGFSDSILRFVAERGEGQLEYIDRIKEVKGLKGHISYENGLSAVNTMTTDAPAVQTLVKTPDWQTLRVFISSTFRDMHGERAALTQRVFPALRRRLMQQGIRCHIVEVDLRWGITSDDAASGLTLSMCLNEVERCRPFFIGLLGERYGHHHLENYVVDKPESECFAWLKGFPPGRSVTELEMMQGALRDDIKGDSKAFFYLRKPQFKDQIPQYEREALSAFACEGPVEEAQMRDLKDRVRASQHKVSVRSYTCTYGGIVNGHPSTADLDNFCTAVIEDLWKAIRQTCPPALGVPSPVEQMRRSQERFQSGHTQVFSGRGKPLKQLLRFVYGVVNKDEEAHTVTVVTGDTGIGKSALLSKLVHSLQQSAGQTLHVFAHYIGAGPSSDTPTDILYHLACDIIEHFGLEFEAVQDYQKLCTLFPELLKTAAALGRLVIVLDNLDRLGHDDLPVLQVVVPENVRDELKVVVSCTPRAAALTALQTRQQTPQVLRLQSLDVEEREALVSDALDLFYKRLEGARRRSSLSPSAKKSPKPNQMAALIRKSGASRPLYLRFALDYLRMIGNFEKLTDQIRGLPSSVEALMDAVLVYLEGLCTPAVANAVLPLIAVSSPISGIKEADLRSVVDVPTHAVCSMLQALGGMLQCDEEESSVDFAHPMLLHAVCKRYVKTDLQQRAVHEKLYSYNKAICAEGGFKGAIPGRVRALLFHGMQSQAPCLLEVLSDLRFLECACVAGSAFPLMTALATVSERNPVAKRKLTEYYDMMLVHLPQIIHRPQLVFQVASNSPDNLAPATAAKKLEATGSWMKWENKDSEKGMCVQRMQGSSQKVLCCTFSPDGKWFACGGSDWVVRVYNVSTGKERLVLEGHQGNVNACAFNASGTLLASAGVDTEVRVWGAQDGGLALRARGHTKPIAGLAFGIKSDVLLTASDDCTVRVWDAAEKARPMLRVLKHHKRPVAAVRVHAGGQLFVTGSWDGVVKLWENVGPDAKVLQTLFTGLPALRDVGLAPTMVQTVACAAVDGRVRLYDMASQQEIVTLNDPVILGYKPNPTQSIAFSPKGDLVASCDVDGGFGVFRACTTGQTLVKVTGHSAAATAVSFAPSGKVLATVSADSEVKFWNSEKPQPTAVHGALCTGVHYAPDGAFVATCSWDGKVKVLDTSASRPSVQYTMWCCSPVLSVCVLPGNERVVSGSTQGKVQVWRVASGIGGAGDERGGSLVCEASAHDAPVGALATVRDCIVSGGWDGMLCLWRVTLQERLQLVWSKAAAHAAEITCLAVSPEGNLASGCMGLEMKMWLLQGGGAGSSDTPEGELSFQEKAVVEHPGWVCALQWVPERPGSLVSVTASGDISLWNAAQRSQGIKCIGSLTARPHAMRLLDADRVAVSCKDRSVRVLRIEDQSLREECIFFLKAPCLALDVFMFKTGLRIACADQFGNVELLSPVFVEAPVALEGDHTADEESLGEESEEYSDDFEEPESLEAEKGPAVEDVEDGLPLLHYRGHPRMTRQQQTRNLMGAMAALGWI
uniref:TROVE domain-containing protein n=1 Tax=Eutreptiella gymnastica TaxID=73025 RepID=A0A7S4G7Z1_9EUGL